MLSQFPGSAVEEILVQGLELLDRLDQESYTRRFSGPLSSSVGAHYRHVLDHFHCLLDGLMDGCVDYDHRPRSTVIENSRDAGVAATEYLIAAYQRFPAATLAQECMVVSNVGYSQPETPAVRSTLARELSYCIGHAIHHFALVKILCASLSVSLPYEFGVAPSTLQYQQSQAVAC